MRKNCVDGTLHMNVYGCILVHACFSIWLKDMALQYIWFTLLINEYIYIDYRNQHVDKTVFLITLFTLNVNRTTPFIFPFTCYGTEPNQWQQMVPPLQCFCCVVASVYPCRYLHANFAKTQCFEQFFLREYMRVYIDDEASQRRSSWEKQPRTHRKFVLESARKWQKQWKKHRVACLPQRDYLACVVKPEYHKICGLVKVYTCLKCLG